MNELSLGHPSRYISERVRIIILSSEERLELALKIEESPASKR